MAKARAIKPQPLPFFNDPKNDIERFFNLQKEYKTGNAAALSGLYQILFKIACKYANKVQAREKLTQDEKKLKAHDAATYIIEQYLKRPDFAFYKNFTGYLYSRVQQEINYIRNCDTLLIFTDTLPDAATKKTRRFLVRNESGFSAAYETATEILLHFPKLRREKLIECINTGAKWKNYDFDYIEV